MNSLTNQQIARVFAIYLPAVGMDIQRHEEAALLGVSFSSEAIEFEENEEGDTDWVSLDRYKLLLTRLSQISDEDAIEVAVMFTRINREHLKFGENVSANESWILYDNGVSRERLMYWKDAPAPVFQFLIQRSYAVPLFIAPNHLDNGKTAMELGLAIDKATGEKEGAS